MTGPNMRPLHCWFCGPASGNVELLFVSSRGGLPPIICSSCVEGFAAVLAAYRVDPAAAVLAVAAHNAVIKGRQAGGPPQKGP
jgi:hypothetical protein